LTRDQGLVVVVGVTVLHGVGLIVYLFYRYFIQFNLWVVKGSI